MNLEEQYKQHARKQRTLISLVAALCLLIAFIALTFGTRLNLLDGILIVFKSCFDSNFETSALSSEKVIVYLRLPRILLAILSGIGLAFSGAIMQSVTRNFLVSPFTLGVSSAAAFGASMCIVFGGATIFFYDVAIISSAFLAAMLSMLVVYAVTKRIGVTANSIILVGIALNYFFAALTASLQFFAQENKLAAVVQWTFGTLNRANWDAVLVVGVVILLCFISSIGMSLRWDVMATGNDELVRSLGVNPDRLRSKTMVLAVLMTATIISFTGVIGFVGLIAPHIARFIVGNNHSHLLPMAAVIGASLLTLADTIGKFILYPVNVPVGIVVSFVGVPVFVHLILNNGRRRTL